MKSEHSPTSANLIPFLDFAAAIVLYRVSALNDQYYYELTEEDVIRHECAGNVVRAKARAALRQLSKLRRQLDQQEALLEADEFAARLKRIATGDYRGLNSSGQEAFRLHYLATTLPRKREPSPEQDHAIAE